MSPIIFKGKKKDPYENPRFPPNPHISCFVVSLSFRLKFPLPRKSPKLCGKSLVATLMIQNLFYFLGCCRRGSKACR